MNFTVIDAPQRSEAWFHARRGRVTGSRAKDVLATIASGEAAKRRDYKLQLCCERLTGTVQEDGHVSPEMQRGLDCEAKAFAAYEALTGDVMQRSGFLAHNTYQMGCSLDGHMDGFTGILELKVPKSATHLRYLRADGVPSEHLAQITHNLLVTGAAWCDFLSWDDRLPSGLQTFLIRVRRQDVDLAGYEAKVLAFLADVETELNAILTMTNVSGALRASVEAVHAL